MLHVKSVMLAVHCKTPYSFLFRDLEKCHTLCFSLACDVLSMVWFEKDLIAARLFSKMSNVEDRQKKWGKGGKGGGGLGGGGGRKKGGEG